MDDAEVRL